MKLKYLGWEISGEEVTLEKKTISIPKIHMFVVVVERHTYKMYVDGIF